MSQSVSKSTPEFVNYVLSQAGPLGQNLPAAHAGNTLVNDLSNFSFIMANSDCNKHLVSLLQDDYRQFSGLITPRKRDCIHNNAQRHWPPGVYIVTYVHSSSVS